MLLAVGFFLYLFYLSLVISYLLVELFALQTQEVLPRQQDATLSRNGTSSVDVVSGNHAHGDACALALSNSLGYLEESQNKGT